MSDFTLRHYSDCLKNALVLGYNFQRFKDLDVDNLNDDLNLVMRHDVDHDLSLVKKMSTEESNIGVRSTYFLRLHARNYNLLSYDSIMTVERLIQDGHEVGLHYEFGWSYDTNEKNLEKLEKELSYLRDIFGDQHFTSISPHEPSRTGDMKFTKAFMKRNNIKLHSYDSRLMSKFKYISDSSCRWREGCMSIWIRKKIPLYILTHPIWWYRNSPGECY